MKNNFNDRIPVIDLFAGPGGLAEGFSSLRHNNGTAIFDISLSVEMDVVAHRTLSLRSFFRKFPPGEVPEEYYQYLRGTISRQDLFSAFPAEAAQVKDEVWCEKLGSGDELNARIDARIDKLVGECRGRWMLIGGPPCQAYSIVGRARRKDQPGYCPDTDDRNFLYREYLRILAIHQPAVFVMENVKGMLSKRVNSRPMFQDILADLRHPGVVDNNSSGRPVEYDIFSLTVPFSGQKEVKRPYAPSDFIIELERYGIPQARHRVILLGLKKGVIDTVPGVLTKEDPVYTGQILDGLPRLRSGLSREKDSWDKWSDLVMDSLDRHWLNHGLRAQGLEVLEDDIMKNLAEISTTELNRGSEFVEAELSVCEKLAEWYLDDRLGGACNHMTRAHMKSDLHRYLFAASFAGRFGRSPKILEFPSRLLPRHKNAKSGDFDDRFKVQVGNRPSATITSHISKDGHYFIHYDPAQCRSLTVREAARLQTFPDNYFFEGSRTQQYIQVGNAVPPLLARKIAGIVRDVFLAAGKL